VKPGAGKQNEIKEERDKMKSSISWDVMKGGPVVHRRVGGMNYLHIQAKCM
jgi:hypothetical protein